MKTLIFDTHKFDQQALAEANHGKHDLHFIDTRLTEKTAFLAKGFDAICCFANDKVDEKSLLILKDIGVRLIALRSAGYNHVDIKKAKELGFTVVRVPAYSPYAVAEHAVGLLLSLNRKIHRAHNRVREMNFSLDGLVGFDLHGKTVGVIGTGRIGKVFCEIMRGFGCKVIAYDTDPHNAWAASHQVQYVPLEILCKDSRIISLHIPLTLETLHIINKETLSFMNEKTVLINTSRGGLIDSGSLIHVLKNHKIAGACLDVYEEEAGIFFNDFSEAGINDDLLARLLSFPNVLITAHQAFLTEEALRNIAATTIENITLFEKGENLDKTKVF